MSDFKANWVGMRELKMAVARNPQMVLSESRKFLTRGMAVYKRGIINAPWRMGQRGGGAPVAVKSKNRGNLRDTHATEINRLSAKIFPTAPYAAYVHGTNGKKVNSRGVQLRPWLDHVRATKAPEIEALYRALLRDIVGDLKK